MIKKHDSSTLTKRIIAKSYFTSLNTNRNDSTREGFGKAISKIGSKKEIVILSADLSDSMKLGHFIEKYPERFFQMGICEQNMMGAASGMSHMGKIPFVVSYAAFNPGRNWDFFRTCVCYSNNPVVVVGGHGGLTTGEDGATHQALEDIAIVRSLPKMIINVPCDQYQAEEATKSLATIKKPAYLRLSREKGISITSSKNTFEIGKAQILDNGEDVVLIACGLGVQYALEAREKLKQQNISAAVINMHTIRPLDTNTLLRYARKCGAIVSIEEHQIRGGLGSEIAETLIRYAPTPQEFVGVDDSFGESGKGYEVLEKHGISVKKIIAKTKAVLKRK